MSSQNTCQGNRSVYSKTPDGEKWCHLLLISLRWIYSATSRFFFFLFLFLNLAPLCCFWVFALFLSLCTTARSVLTLDSLCSLAFPYGATFLWKIPMYPTAAMWLLKPSVNQRVRQTINPGHSLLNKVCITFQSSVLTMNLKNKQKPHIIF